ncbi:MAG: nucleotidyl transferase AbiEii/AbiGii toxin family protein [Chloroflexi bacterium]|nr:nucleotidyl transferase AbiEii/AbiGii toxin family protein [Chloroflexota bacterium]
MLSAIRYPPFAIRSDLAAEGYAVELKVNDHKVVHSAFVRLVGLLHQLGLSPHRDEVLAVKIEVDTNPPSGATLTTTVVRRYITLHLQHHDRASLLAGKLHAILNRPYTKGRDLYDLLWYLSDPGWPSPNLTLLNNALRQSGWSKPYPNEESWREMARDQLLTLDWVQVVADVRPFLEPTADLSLLTLDNVRQVLEKRR